MKKIRVGIVGSAGYTGGELIRLLVFHPQVEIVFAHSESNAGNKIHDVHQDLFGDTDLTFAKDFNWNIDVLYLCLGHGNSRRFLDSHNIPEGVKIIDLAQDYRLSAANEYKGKTFVYGLPELNREKIRSAEYIANPGCFATGLTLSLLPLAKHNLLPDSIHMNAITGSTGAGQRPSPTTHFSWRANNISAYKVFEHQHLQEISESLNSLQPGYVDTDQENLIAAAAEKIHIIPQRGDFPRGIFSTTYLKCDLELSEAYSLFEEFYAEHPFTHVSLQNVHLKQVVSTNKVLLHLEKKHGMLLITAVEDNLVKGASGQAVQNMNLMFSLDEKAGLQLKSIAF